MTDPMVEISKLVQAEREQSIISLEAVRAFIHPRQDTRPTRVFIVRQEGRPEWVCGVYSTMELAKQNQHRHQWNTDEIITWVLDEPPLLYDAPPNYEQL